MAIAIYSMSCGATLQVPGRTHVVGKYDDMPQAFSLKHASHAPLLSRSQEPEPSMSPAAWLRTHAVSQSDISSSWQRDSPTGSAFQLTARRQQKALYSGHTYLIVMLQPAA